MLGLLEMISVVAGLIQGMLILLKKKENWVFYIIMSVSLTVFSAGVNLWGDVMENLVYLAMGFLGWAIWYGKIKTKKEYKTTYCTAKERIAYLVVIGVITLGMHYYLKLTNDPFPFLDALTTALGLTATYLMVIKKVDSWILWFIDDILMVCIYFMIPNQAIYLGLLNVIWTGMAVGSLISWHKETKLVQTND